MRRRCSARRPYPHDARSPEASPPRGGGNSSGRHAQTYNTRVQSKVRNLAAASATCQPAAAARRSQARRGAHPPQDAGVHLRPRLRPAHGRLPTRVRGRRAVVEDLGVRPPDGGQAAADDARPRPPEHAAPAAGGLIARTCLDYSRVIDPLPSRSPCGARRAHVPLLIPAGTKPARQSPRSAPIGIGTCAAAAVLVVRSHASSVSGQNTRVFTIRAHAYSLFLRWTFAAPVV